MGEFGGRTAHDSWVLRSTENNRDFDAIPFIQACGEDRVS